MQHAAGTNGVWSGARIGMDAGHGSRICQFQAKPAIAPDPAARTLTRAKLRVCGNERNGGRSAVGACGPHNNIGARQSGNERNKPRGTRIKTYTGYPWELVDDQYLFLRFLDNPQAGSRTRTIVARCIAYIMNALTLAPKSSTSSATTTRAVRAMWALIPASGVSTALITGSDYRVCDSSVMAASRK
ncbi:hypothetical protein GGX14DRAFT_402089 [Mycena pura]|uniref:Uncharacterized protein n=1 Tax=Mycena pura TaxID=153505 RepID=A0AAD6UYM8_9AGAR|nr:hypothetical protein GGX14DRAFT_402089 [Mycena pura]